MRSTQFEHSLRQRRAGAMLRFQSLALASSLAFAPIGFAVALIGQQPEIGHGGDEMVEEGVHARMVRTSGAR